MLIFVTEDFSDSLRVKADPGKHPAADVYPVLKLNVVRHFQTGIYDYNVMTSIFARVAPGWPLAKISFSSQEWCGHVYHQILPRERPRRRASSTATSTARPTARTSCPCPKDGVFEDALPILLRGWNGAVPEAGGEPHGAVPAEPLPEPARPQTAGLGEGHDQPRGRRDGT